LAFLLALGGAVLGGVGSTKSALAAEETGRQSQLAAEGEAVQLEAQAKKGIAVGSYNADRVGKRAKQIISSQRAAAAAGGGDTTDQTVTAITDETIREASMEQLLIMADARDRANQDEFAAKVTRRTGIAQNKRAQSEATAERFAGAATILNSAASWQQKYGS
jgi:hypothetical protein